MLMDSIGEGAERWTHESLVMQHSLQWQAVQLSRVRSTTCEPLQTTHKVIAVWKPAGERQCAGRIKPARVERPGNVSKAHAKDKAS